MASSDLTRKPTIRDVAAVAGVSHGTVSRVINGGHWVSPEARAAVEEAIRTTGYTTNHAARSLATGRSGSLAFLLTESQQLLFSDPTFALLLRGATAALAERAMTLVLLAYVPVVLLARAVGGDHGPEAAVVTLWLAFTAFMVLRGACMAWRIRGDAWAVTGATR